MGRHALSWIEEHGTKLREITFKRLREVTSRIDGECTWCGIECGSLWCSEECRDEFDLRCDKEHYIMAVYHRDKGICQICDYDLMEAAFSGIFDRHPHIDHVVSVAKGGGLCDLNGLRLLCNKCHMKHGDRTKSTKRYLRKEADHA